MQDFCKKGAAKGKVCLPERCEKYQYLIEVQLRRCVWSKRRLKADMSA